MKIWLPVQLGKLHKATYTTSPPPELKLLQPKLPNPRTTAPYLHTLNTRCCPKDLQSRPPLPSRACCTSAFDTANTFLTTTVATPPRLSLSASASSSPLPLYCDTALPDRYRYSTATVTAATTAATIAIAFDASHSWH